MSGDEDIAALLPWSGPMRLVGDVLEHDGERTLCAIDPRRSQLFMSPDGSLPAWLALEYMAQCAGVHGALLRRASARAARLPGEALLLGTRRLTLHVDRFDAGRRLIARAQDQRTSRDLVSVDCAILQDEGGAPLVEARIAIHVPGIERGAFAAGTPRTEDEGAGARGRSGAEEPTA